MSVKRLLPVHPGEILREEFLKPMGISQAQLARELRVSFKRINEIVLGKRGIDAETALRLARYFGTSAEFWAGLQSDYDLDSARDKNQVKIESEVKVRSSGFLTNERITRPPL